MKVERKVLFGAALIIIVSTIAGLVLTGIAAIAGASRGDALFPLGAVIVFNTLVAVSVILTEMMADD